jgi:hypothetical protein
MLTSSPRSRVHFARAHRQFQEALAYNADTLHCNSGCFSNTTASKSSEAWRQTTLDIGIAFLALVAFVVQQPADGASATSSPSPSRSLSSSVAIAGAAESSVFGPCSAQHVLASSQGRFANCSMHARREMRAPLGFQHASLVVPRDVRPARD